MTELERLKASSQIGLARYSMSLLQEVLYHNRLETDRRVLWFSLWIDLLFLWTEFISKIKVSSDAVVVARECSWNLSISVWMR